MVHYTKVFQGFAAFLDQEIMPRLSGILKWVFGGATELALLNAQSNFETLKNKDSFKSWLLGIANNKCKDYYRKQAQVLELPFDELSETALGVGRLGITEQSVVQETLETLGDKEKQILYLYFFK